MMSRTQITLENEVQRRARQRASELGISLAECVRRLVARDLARPETAVAVDSIFDLGSSGGADIATDKDSMIAEAASLDEHFSVFRFGPTRRQSLNVVR